MESATPGPPSGPPLPAVLAAYAAVYLIWGSTYLAIRFAIESIPPFLMAGVRFTVAGVVLYAWTRLVRKARRPTRAEWSAAAVVGGLLLLGGNGLVVWAEQWVPSGLAALLVATVPLWMVLMDWWTGGPRPGPGLVFGLLWGLLGVGLLVGAPGVETDRPAQLTGAGAVLLASFLWAAGSIYARGASLPRSPRLGTAMQMLAGGVLLLLAGTALGEWGTLDLSAVTLKSALALAYLIVFGALVAFSAYIWLLRVSTAARVSTYAYVNPVVALFLGWALADEPISARTFLAAFVILTAVMLITVRGGGRWRGDRRRGRAGKPDTS